ncbi:MAG TPA: hypothetical protein VGC51_02140 [Hansschlegelia sp.]
MSTVTLVIVLGSIIATAVFAAGYVRGVRNAFGEYRLEERDPPVPQHGHWGGIAFALLASIVIITAIGFSSAWVYAGPFLCLVTTLGVGVAFFIEKTPASKV